MSYRNSTNTRGSFHRTQRVSVTLGASKALRLLLGTQAGSGRGTSGVWCSQRLATAPWCRGWKQQWCCFHPLSSAPQIVGSRLRIPQVTPADSGEYVCHVSNGAGSQETSLIVTIESRGPSHGENMVDRDWASERRGARGPRVPSMFPVYILSPALLCSAPSAQCLPTNED